jgi:uncharacterized damage-inducible protein DinB
VPAHDENRTIEGGSRRMSIADTLVPEFDREMAITRRTLDRVPDARFAWKPHAKSTTIGGLATHLANLPNWARYTLAADTFDMAPPGQEPLRIPEAASTADVLDAFDSNVAAARAALAVASDEHMRATWTLLKAGEVVLAMPRAASIRSFVLNHMIHHRGQLSVYLRLVDVAVPSIYGPSADEAM